MAAAMASTRTKMVPQAASVNRSAAPSGVNSPVNTRVALPSAPPRPAATSTSNSRTKVAQTRKPWRIARPGSVTSAAQEATKPPAAKATATKRPVTILAITSMLSGGSANGAASSPAASAIRLSRTKIPKAVSRPAQIDPQLSMSVVATTGVATGVATDSTLMRSYSAGSSISPPKAGCDLQQTQQQDDQDDHDQ